jgi:sugar phosphate isomerase/epimerase
MDQAIRFCDLLADHARKHKMLIALEPMAGLNTLWPRYRDGLKFMKEVGRKEIKVMADLAYFLELKQPLEDILLDPEACLHVHMAGVGGQPGLGDRVAVHTKLFRILRDMGYERGVSAACPWASSTKGKMNFGRETAKTLKYLRNLRAKVYAE